MVKNFIVYSIPEETDGNDFWQYHMQVHARDVWKAAAPFRTRYVLYRMKRTLYGNHHVFGIVEIGWPSEAERLKEEAAVSKLRLADGRKIREDFQSRVKDSFSVLVEEYDVIKAETGNPSVVSGDGRGCKRFTIYSIPKGANGDDFWRYHAAGHARDVWKATHQYGKIQYLMNRVRKTLYGKHDLFCFIETKWTSEGDSARDDETLKAVRLKNGMSISEDFLSRLKHGYSILVDEYDIIGSKMVK